MDGCFAYELRCKRIKSGFDALSSIECVSDACAIKLTNTADLFLVNISATGNLI